MLQSLRKYKCYIPIFLLLQFTKAYINYVVVYFLSPRAQSVPRFYFKNICSPALSKCGTIRNDLNDKSFRKR